MITMAPYLAHRLHIDIIDMMYCCMNFQSMLQRASYLDAAVLKGNVKLAIRLSDSSNAVLL